MEEWKSLTEAAVRFVLDSPLNLVPEFGNMQIYQPPIFGVAAADDSLFEKFKEPQVVGKAHKTPTEWLPEARSVISYFLPFTQKIRKSNHADDKLPSSEWLHARIRGKPFNDSLREFLVCRLKADGVAAVAPIRDDRFEVIDMRGNWSERHAAFAAGLGTFDLSCSLITEKGCAGRYGSVITTQTYKPTERSYEGIHEYCTGCGTCIERCPVRAITEEGKDHAQCAKYTKEFVPNHLSLCGCGKCQTRVPCEHRIPEKK